MAKVKVVILFNIFLQVSQALFLDQLMSDCHGLPFCNEPGRQPSLVRLYNGQNQNGQINSGISNNFQPVSGTGTIQQNMIDGSFSMDIPASSENSFGSITGTGNYIDHTNLQNKEDHSIAAAVLPPGRVVNGGRESGVAQTYSYSNEQTLTPNGYRQDNSMNSMGSPIIANGNSYGNSVTASSSKYTGGTGSFAAQHNDLSNTFGPQFGIAAGNGQMSTQASGGRSPFAMNDGSVSITHGQNGQGGMDTGSGISGGMITGSGNGITNPMINGGGNGMANHFSAPGMGMAQATASFGISTSGNHKSKDSGAAAQKGLTIVFGNTDGITYENGKFVIPKEWAVKLLSALQGQQRQHEQHSLQQHQQQSKIQPCKPVDKECPKNCMEFAENGCTVCNCENAPCPKFPDDCPRGKSKINNNGCPVCMNNGRSEELDWYRRIWSK